jgi:chromate reductase
MVVLGISGSLRAGSYNSRLLDAAEAELPAGVELQRYPGLGDIPPYREDAEHPAPRPVRALREAIRAADAVLIATPEYNGSLPGQLKNVLDWASRPFPDNSLRGKPVLVVGASAGLFGAVWAQAEARRVLGIIGADVVDGELPVGQANGAFDANSRLADIELRTRLTELLELLVGRASEVTAA